MRRRNVLGAASVTAALASGCGGSAPSNAAGATGTRAPAAAPAPGGKKTATIELEKGGTITMDLFPDAAPNWVNNFVQKSMAGFYNGLTFHRVEDWVIQGGDPRGNGTGGGQIATELNDRPFTMGSVGVARGQDIRVSNDAQFFIVMMNGPAQLGGKWTQLDRQYTNFGQVTDGMETARKVVKDDKIKRITIKG